MSTDSSPRPYRPGAHAAAHPTRPAVITSSGAFVTFAELEARSCRLAQALHARGLRGGDHVACVLPNDDRTHEVAFGLQRSGVYYTMVNTHLAAEEAAYIVNDCGARTLITSASLAGLAAELVPLTPGVDLRLMVGEPTAAGYASYDEFVRDFPGEPVPGEEEGFPMLYSSGSFSRRTNIVGTNWAWVTRCSSMSRRQSSGSKRSMTTTVPPMRCTVMDHTSGAEW